MPETFLILLAAGVMLAAALSNPQDVTLNWLRLAGIIALALGGLSIFFFLRREAGPSAFFHRMQLVLLCLFLPTVLLQLAYVQIAWRTTQRVISLLAVVVGVLSGTGLLHEMIVSRSTGASFSKPVAVSLQAVACLGIAAMTGLCLMGMLLGHAYLTASRMTNRPFARLNTALITATIARVVVSIGLVLVLQSLYPIQMLWGVQGLFIITRWCVGLFIPAIFIFMARDCIRRRATQSATGILYVAAILIFIGEIIALYLVRETRLPF